VDLGKEKGERKGGKDATKHESGVGVNGEVGVGRERIRGIG
jgi:hypothetical protein